MVRVGEEELEELGFFVNNKLLGGMLVEVPVKKKQLLFYEIIKFSLLIRFIYSKRNIYTFLDPIEHKLKRGKLIIKNVRGT